MRVLMWCQLWLLPLVSSRAVNGPRADTTADAQTSGAPPVPQKYTKGTVFYYDGYQKTDSRVKDYETMWSQLISLLNLVDQPEKSNEVFQRWFNPYDMPVVEDVFARMWEAVEPPKTNSKRDDTPKVWITSRDIGDKCGSGSPLAYTGSFGALPDDIRKKMVSQYSMSNQDCIIHFCEKPLDYILERQFVDCDEIPLKRMSFSVAGNATATLLHELIHCSFIGDKAMQRYRLDDVFTGGGGEGKEIYDPYQCSAVTDDCSSGTAVRNPQNYQYYAANRYWNNKCSFDLKAPAPKPPPKSDALKQYVVGT